MIKDIENVFSKMKLGNLVCIPINSTFSLKGKFTRNNLRSMELSIRRCDNTTNSTTICADDTAVDNFFTSDGTVYVNLVFANPLINPGNIDYLDYYLEDRNFFTFSQTQGSYCIG